MANHLIPAIFSKQQNLHLHQHQVLRLAESRHPSQVIQLIRLRKQNFHPLLAMANHLIPAIFSKQQNLHLHQHQVLRLAESRHPSQVIQLIRLRKQNFHPLLAMANHLIPAIFSKQQNQIKLLELLLLVRYFFSIVLYASRPNRAML